mgnify:CR=1 FL=1
MKSLKLIILVIGILLLSVPSPGLTEEAKEGKREVEGKKIVKLEEMVVTATGRQTALKVFEKPQSITIIDREEIERKKPQSIGDLLRELPGVEITQTQSAYKREPYIRGLGGHRVLILVDGERLSTQTFLSGTPLSDIDPEEVEYVEIIRGPTSVRYGPDALGGVINIVTRRFKPEEEFKVGGVMEGYFSSAYDLHRERISLYGGKRGVDFSLRFTSADAGNTKIPESVDPFITHSGRLRNSDFKYESLSLKTGYEFKPDQHLFLDYMRHRGEDIGMASTISKQGPMTIDSKDFEFPETGLDLIRLKYLWEKEEGTLRSLEIKGSWQKIGWEFFHAPHLRLDFPPLDMKMYAHHDSDAESLTLSTLGTLLLGREHEVSSGIEYRRTKAMDDVYDHRRKSLAGIIPLQNKVLHSRPEVKQHDLRTFIQDEVDVGRFTLSPGVSYEWLKANKKRGGDKIWQGIGAALGLVYHLNPNLNLTGCVARGFRIPTVEESFFITPHSGSVIKGNWDMDPETSMDYEIGVKGNYPNLFFTISLFYTKVFDMIAITAPQGYRRGKENVLQWDNIEEVKIWGSEVSIRYYLLDDWSLYANLAYTHTEQKGGEKMAEPPPPVKGTAGTLFTKGLERAYIKDLWVELYTRFASRIKNRPPCLEEFYFNPPNVPGYALFNLAFGVRLENLWGIREQRLVFKIENFTDKLYFEGISGSPHGLSNFPQAGRNFVFSWTFRF